jgi:hypothetical protein
VAAVDTGERAPHRPPTPLPPGIPKHVVLAMT